jgi:hypothetical protein
VIVLGAVGGYFAYQQGAAGHKNAAAAAGTQSAEVQPPPGGTCGTALARVRDYGVVPYNTKLSGDTEGKKTDDGRIACAATSGDQTYSMLVNVMCDDLSNPKCLEVYRVTEGKGTALYQKRPYSF